MLLLRASRADAIDEHVVPGVFEATGQLRLRIHIASFKLMHCSTGVALEVMMMGLACDFIPGRITRNFNCRKPFVFHQTADIPVDGSNTQSVYLLLGEGERFVRRQRTISLEKGRANRFLLTRVSSLRWASHSDAIVPFCEIILN